MSLQEFDAVIDKMQLALEYSFSLGQPVEAAKVLYQMNEMLPDDLHLSMEELDDENAAKSFVSKYKPQIKSAISEYRQRQMTC